VKPIIPVVAEAVCAAPVQRVTATPSFRTIQALRGLAALLVVVYHAFDMWAVRINPGAPGAAWTNGAAGVDIFFVISGFVMVVSSRRLLAQPGAWMTFMRHRANCAALLAAHHAQARACLLLRRSRAQVKPRS
jgi:peptidoglycan/LPS O-acetylase OafA/YrhL